MDSRTTRAATLARAGTTRTGGALGAAHDWFDSPVVEAPPSPMVELGQWRDAARGLRWLAYGATAAWI